MITRGDTTFQQFEGFNEIEPNTTIGYDETKFTFAFGFISSANIDFYEEDDINEYVDLTVNKVIVN